MKVVTTKQFAVITLAAAGAIFASPAGAVEQTVDFGSPTVLSQQGQRLKVVLPVRSALDDRATAASFMVRETEVPQGYQPLPAQDVEASVRFKAVSGRVDQAAGLAVRLQDADNYYIARANALEGNVRLYRVVKGDRKQLASASVKVPSGQWHTLTLRAEGDRLSVSFNGKPLITQTDQTFLSLGKVALWTKADSVTHFDQIRITPLKVAAQSTPPT